MSLPVCSAKYNPLDAPGWRHGPHAEQSGRWQWPHTITPLSLRLCLSATQAKGTPQQPGPTRPRLPHQNLLITVSSDYCFFLAAQKSHPTQVAAPGWRFGPRAGRSGRWRWTRAAGLPRADGGHHGSAAVAAQAVSQHGRHHAVPVGDVGTPPRPRPLLHRRHGSSLGGKVWSECHKGLALPGQRPPSPAQAEWGPVWGLGFGTEASGLRITLNPWGVQVWGLGDFFEPRALQGQAALSPAQAAWFLSGVL